MKLKKYELDFESFSKTQSDKSSSAMETSIIFLEHESSQPYLEDNQIFSSFLILLPFEE
jgi:hypothetical protein